MGHATIEETFPRYGHLMPGARNQARALVDAYMVDRLKAGVHALDSAGRGPMTAVGSSDLQIKNQNVFALAFFSG